MLILDSANAGLYSMKRVCNDIHDIHWGTTLHREAGLGGRLRKGLKQVNLTMSVYKSAAGNKSSLDQLRPESITK